MDDARSQTSAHGRPGARWIGHLAWHDLLFAHWPVPAAALRPHVPPGLEIDEFDGSAWLGVIPFDMTSMYVRGLPPLPGLARTLELNVRTYVRLPPSQGVYFFSLDAANWLAVMGARATYHLNYRHARMSLVRRGGRILYVSRRIHRGAPAAEFRGVYSPTGPPFLSKPGSIEYWLTERYTMFGVDGRGRIHRGDIDHPRWMLQPAEAEFDLNAMTAQIGLELPHVPPLLHFSKSMDVHVWLPQRLGRTGEAR